MTEIRTRDRVAFWLTYHLPLVSRIRGWWHDRKGRPGFRMEDYR
jgi:hypothetical protein